MNIETPSSKLAEKLDYIRSAVKVSQIDMILHLGLKGLYDRSYISVWEHGKSEPPLIALLRYAHLAGVALDTIVDDSLNLPTQQRIHSRHDLIRKSKQKYPSSKRLASKLKLIRSTLDFNQREMIDLLGLGEIKDRAYISHWENGKLNPPLIALIRYARAGGVSLNALADDEAPFSLPPQIYQGHS